MVRAATPRDTLWAMEEAVKTSGIAAVIGELAQDGQAADLTATRRLSLAAQQGLGETLLDTEGGNRQARRDGFFLPPHGLIQALHQLGAETRGQRRARAGHDVADGLEAKLDKPVTYLGRKAQRG